MSHDPDRPGPGLRLLRLLLPSLCPGCSRASDPGSPVCGRCMQALNRAPVIRADPPEGLAGIVSCAPHEGIARQLLASWKFRGMGTLEGLISGYMSDLVAPAGEGLLVVPVPASPVRARLRGFDPAAAMAGRIATSLSAERPRPEILVRRGSGRQRGRGRSGRIGSPPDIRPAPDAGDLAGRPVLLVDDVITTGATLAVSARALRGIGAGTVRGVTFTRRL